LANPQGADGANGKDFFRYRAPRPSAADHTTGAIFDDLLEEVVVEARACKAPKALAREYFARRQI
jgi:hypothetical protein